MKQFKKSILVVSFGTTHQDVAKASIEAIEQRIAEKFSDYEVRRAFTSEIIRKILRQRDGLHVDNVEEALTGLRIEGFQEVIIQPLHVICGEEYHEKILRVSTAYQPFFQKLAVGNPLLTTIADYVTAIKALQTQLPRLREKQAVVLMGHGSGHPANASYACLQLMLMDELPQVYIGTVEGYPALEHLLPKLKAANLTDVMLMPYMVVAGDHAKNDLAGDQEDSWKSILKKEGFRVRTHLHGLGENPAYQEMYVQHIRKCIFDSTEMR